jgi:hypothetical protein
MRVPSTKIVVRRYTEREQDVLINNINVGYIY